MEKGPGRVSPAAEAAGLSLNADAHPTSTVPTTNEEKDDS